MEEDNGETSGELEEDEFYTKAKNYWSNMPPTVNGMLGGFGHINQADITGSEQFLKLLFKSTKGLGNERALDCGAGIGRITKYLLVKHFNTVDLVDQCREFTDAAKTYIQSDKVDQIYCCGLQNFKPIHKYDVIWCQWVLGHLTDEHFVQFMNNCKEGLKENGLIVVKENITSGDKTDIDEVDSSVTRPLSMLKELFDKSGLDCLKIEHQSRFPKGLYPVKMIALKQKSQD